MKKFLAIVLLVLPLTACNDGFSEMDWRYLPGAGGGGGGAPAPAQPAPGYSNGQPLAPGVHKMLEDPEAEAVNDSEEVWATTQEDAERRCEEIAAQRTSQGGTLVTVQGVSRVNSKKFFCQFRAETGGRN